MTYEAVFTQATHSQACELLLPHVQRQQQQEDLCFALWRPATGAERRTALVYGLVLPQDGERHLHGNASFEAAYLARAIRVAHADGAGLAFLHNHLRPRLAGHERYRRDCRARSHCPGCPPRVASPLSA